MFVALNACDERIYIDEASKDEKYFCPMCKSPLILKGGDKKRLHFAHTFSHKCNDTWKENKSLWYYEWLNQFPRNVQEMVIEYNGQKHRADILIEKTVVEFQEGPISSKNFDERNLFFISAGYRVVWVVNLIEKFQDGIISLTDDSSEDAYTWKRGSTTYTNFDYQNSEVSLYFQDAHYSEEEVDRHILKKVTWNSQKFMSFRANCGMSAQEFVRMLNPQGETIDKLWNDKKGIKVGRFRNLETGYEVIIRNDPLKMSKKYRGKIYGDLKRKNGTPTNAQIYYWDMPQWILIDYSTDSRRFL